MAAFPLMARRAAMGRFYFRSRDCRATYDPPSGIIVTANSRIVGRDYRSPRAEWAEPYRARRIYDLLSTRRIDGDDFRRVQGDTYSIGAALFARELLKIAPQMTALAPDDDQWRATLRLLEEWERSRRGRLPCGVARRGDA